MWPVTVLTVLSYLVRLKSMYEDVEWAENAVQSISSLQEIFGYFVEDPNAQLIREITIGFQNVLNRMNTMEKTIILEIKSDELREKMATIQAQTMKLDATLEAAGNNTAELEAEITKFITDYERMNIELEIVSLLTATLPESQSYLDALLARIKDKEKSGGLTTSAHQTVYDVYLFLVNKIVEANTLNRFAVAVKIHNQGQQMTNKDFLAIDARLKMAIDALNKAMKKTLSEISSNLERIFYSKLSTGSEDEAKRALPSDYKSIKMYTGKMTVRPDHVVTGARFTQKGDAFYLQLQSAKPMPYGAMNPANMTWEDLPTDDSFATFSVLTPCFGSLDNTDSVLTGARIVEQNVVHWADFGQSSSANAAVLQVFGRSFNFTTGQLYGPEVDATMIKPGTMLYPVKSSPLIETNLYFSDVQETHMEPPFGRFNTRITTYTQLDTDDSSLGAPVKTISFMRNTFHDENSIGSRQLYYRLKPYVASRDYSAFL